MNMVNNWIYDYVMYSWIDKDPYTVLVIDELKNLAREPGSIAQSHWPDADAW